MNAFPLAPFLVSLTGDGMRPTLDDYTRISCVLRTEGPWTISRLRQVLLALLVKNAEQERLFLKRFNDFFQPETEADFAELDLQQALADLQRLAGPEPQPPKPPLTRRLRKAITPPPTLPPRAQFAWGMTAAFATIAILALAVWKFRPEPAPSIRISPKELHFGNLVVGSENIQSVTLTNTGSAPLTISRSNILGKDSTHFTLSITMAGRTLARDSSLTIPIRCLLDSMGPRHARLEIVTNAKGSPHQVPLTAIGIAATQPPPTETTRQRLYTNVPFVKEIRYTPLKKPEDWKTFAKVAALFLIAILAT